ncbi:ATP-dependent DNA helicase [Trichonephila clavipes]|nr:ATP-dependent DNA helicase [Trichonephila clavipes]
MQDLRGNTLLFGGATFLFAEDFRQILPVVTKGEHIQPIQNLVKFFFDVGEGKCPEVNSTHDIELPTNICQVVVDTESSLHSIYDDVHDLNIKEDSWLCERSILAPINDQVSVLNQRMLDKIPGESQTYLFINTVCHPDEAVNYPT